MTTRHRSRSRAPLHEADGASMLDLHPDSPWRPPDYRWRTALLLARHPRLRLRRYADDATLAALDFVRAMGRCRGDADRERLARRSPDLTGARAIHEAAPPHSRWSLEARILSGESPESIGPKLGLTPDVIEAYERLFFAVGERLACPNHICCQIIGPRLYTGMTDRDLDAIWMFFGYRYGPIMLDRLIPLSLGPAWGAHLGEVVGELDEDLAFIFKIKLLLALHAPMETNSARLAMLRLYQRLQEREIAKNRAPAPDFRACRPAASILGEIEAATSGRRGLAPLRAA